MHMTENVQVRKSYFSCLLLKASLSNGNRGFVNYSYLTTKSLKKKQNRITGGMKSVIPLILSSRCIECIPLKCLVFWS